MALLDLESEQARASDGMPFANGFEGENWMSVWCDDCKINTDCPLILVAMLGRTPKQWEDRNPGYLNRYVCHEFVRTEEEQ